MHQTCEPAILYFGTPVVLVATVNENGSANLAPLSSVFWLGWRGILGLSAASQTAQNLIRTRQCTLNLPSADMVPQIDRLALTTGTNPVPAYKAARGYVHIRDKFEHADLTAAPSLTVSAPRVAQCPAQMECVVEAIHSLAADSDEQRGKLLTVEVRVKKVHLDDAIMLDGHQNRVDPDKWRPLIMSFQHFYSLGPKIHPSKLSSISEEQYLSTDVARARAEDSRQIDQRHCAEAKTR